MVFFNSSIKRVTGSASSRDRIADFYDGYIIQGPGSESSSAVRDSLAVSCAWSNRWSRRQNFSSAARARASATMGFVPLTAAGRCTRRSAHRRLSPGRAWRSRRMQWSAQVDGFEISGYTNPLKLETPPSDPPASCCGGRISCRRLFCPVADCRGPDLALKWC